MDNIGLSDPQKELGDYVANANTLLKTLKNEVTAPHNTKTLRTWKIGEAAALLGRSSTYIQQNEGKDKLLGEPLINPDTGRRYYTLERINFIRDKLKCGVKRPEGVPSTIISIGVFKGGSTKTTTTIHLAQRAALKGHKVLVVDLDPQASLTFLLGYESQDAIQSDGTLDRVLIEGEPIKDHITSTYFTGIDVIKGSIALQDTELVLFNDQYSFLENPNSESPVDRLSHALNELKDEYDLILMDLPPNLGMLTLSALRASNGLIVPLSPSMLDYHSAVKFVDTYRRIIKDRDQIDLFRVLLSRFSNNIEDQNILSLLQFTFKDRLISNYMVQSEEIKRNASEFSTVYEIEKPRGSKATFKRAIEHYDLCNDEILGLVYRLWEKKAKAHNEQFPLFKESVANA